MSDLKKRLESLGLSQYYDVFVSEGFDTWETILDITESDLNALNVKLGHRRKLQRAILETRSQFPERALPLSYGKAPSAEGSYRSDDSATESKSLKRPEPAPPPASNTTSKRKYRRHPKQDENAPERPPSAYVIFSNQMREELKGRELSFTEIAKVVGERWQVLLPESREVFERQANTAKEKYYAELAEYKKTPQYAEYQEYLKEFKAKHGPPPSGADTLHFLSPRPSPPVPSSRRPLTHTSDGKKAKLETETSGSTRSSSHDQAERHVLGSGASDPYLLGHRRSGSSPPRTSYSRGIRQSISQSTSPATYSFSNVNSPRMSEQYSPSSTSPTAAHIVREPTYDYHHHGGFPGHDHGPNVSQPTPLQSYPSASPTPPSIAGFGSQYPNTRELPTRRPYRDSASLPPLTHEDTTLSSTTISSGTSHGSVRPEPRLPVVDPSKAQRLLPQPVPTLNPKPSPFDHRPPQVASALPAPTHDLRSGSSSLAALLRASELARDADNPLGDNDPPP